MYEIKDNIIVELLKKEIKNNQHSNLENCTVMDDFYRIELDTPKYYNSVLEEHLAELASSSKWHVIKDKEILSSYINYPQILDNSKKVTFLMLKPIYKEFSYKVLGN